MKPAHERDRDTALAVARGRARRGDEPGADRWFALAGTFAAPTERQKRAHAAALASGRRGVVIAGQLDLDGNVAAGGRPRRAARAGGGGGGPDATRFCRTLRPGWLTGLTRHP